MVELADLGDSWLPRTIAAIDIRFLITSTLSYFRLTVMDLQRQNMGSVDEEGAPKPGHWPVPPQEDQPISKDRIWIDGCFDFSHHGEHSAIESATQAQADTGRSCRSHASSPTPGQRTLGWYSFR